jgi:hypothetical protein
MASETIERVAQAILDSATPYHDKASHRAALMAQARAAIEAMREPTDEMCKAAGEDRGPDDHWPPCTTWQMMIDAALKESAEA